MSKLSEIDTAKIRDAFAQSGILPGETISRILELADASVGVADGDDAAMVVEFEVRFKETRTHWCVRTPYQMFLRNSPREVVLVSLSGRHDDELDKLEREVRNTVPPDELVDVSIAAQNMLNGEMFSRVITFGLSMPPCTESRREHVWQSFEPDGDRAAVKTHFCLHCGCRRSTPEKDVVNYKSDDEEALAFILRTGLNKLYKNAPADIKDYYVDIVERLLEVDVSDSFDDITAESISSKLNNVARVNAIIQNFETAIARRRHSRQMVTELRANYIRRLYDCADKEPGPIVSELLNLVKANKSNLDDDDFLDEVEAVIENLGQSGGEVIPWDLFVTDDFSEDWEQDVDPERPVLAATAKEALAILEKRIRDACVGDASAYNPTNKTARIDMRAESMLTHHTGEDYVNIEPNYNEDDEDDEGEGEGECEDETDNEVEDEAND